MRQAYLILLALSLRDVLYASLAGAEGKRRHLSSYEYETLLQFVLKNPRVAERYHSPKVCKKQWLQELEEVL